MSLLPQAKINEMAKEIAIGNTCYIHRYTAKITVINHSLEDAKLIAAQEQTQAELEKKGDDYVKIEKLNKAAKMEIMRNFLEDVEDRAVRKELSNALNRKNPARNFMMAVDSDMELNQHWRNFNVKEYQRWVANVIIDAYNY